MGGAVKLNEICSKQTQDFPSDSESKTITNHDAENKKKITTKKQKCIEKEKLALKQWY